MVTDSDTGALREYLVQGTTYAPIGAITTAGGQPVTAQELNSESLVRLSEISAICNDAKIVYSEVSFHSLFHASV